MWSSESSCQAFQAPVDVHASADGQVYRFQRRQNESAAASSDDEELHVLEMRPRPVQLVERELRDGDNVNKLALQYGCKVADLKRVNNLMHNHDLYALKSVRIPMHRHGVTSEMLTGTNDAAEQRVDVSQPHAQSVHVCHQATHFLMEMDANLHKVIHSSTSNHHHDDGLDVSERPHRFGLRGLGPKSPGSDWGIQWWNAVVAMLLIGVVLPLFYVIYFKTKDAGVVSTAGSLLEASLTSNNISVNSSEHVQEPG
ncbi:lysM and putative peptidoglycan-binding domain-containing protein 4 [Gouania willdenowi]|uniref:LysM and putative peptidoglycan-binding domain-containing protein 4 n=1 Tax=Gouania willdenowi TaxID=441366 RepID=A0A8C5DSP6_GOUWI|nr:lysM and putative peptidoglycan-binding domain-containing protein 4-like [Gouania willdenowi]XP_028307625.1 lysM and putative peptidoglycan-binding domain-containing protein 4-like [Gouania willdenowi]XP_028307626.1 lysM and putative peptidoglycan-binding domain-containing protein 4-like [Gouania willdenowi]